MAGHAVTISADQKRTYAQIIDTLTSIFDPMRLVGGIELSDDPLLMARSAVYALSYERRQQSSSSGALSARSRPR